MMQGLNALTPTPEFISDPCYSSFEGNTVSSVIIIGGGASGVLLACHLLRDPAVNLCVTIIEKRPDVGRGIAYGTANPHHVLNVRTSNMSAFADVPDHFWKWLAKNNIAGCRQLSDPFCFVPRTLYGRYIASSMEPLQSAGRLEIVQGECVGIRESESGVVTMLADGSAHASQIAVLATGYERQDVGREDCLVDPWTAPSDAGIARNAAVLILGTGLSMVDYVLSLIHAGHQGSITAISRRGLLPRAHRRVEALAINKAEIPLGASAVSLLCWFRNFARHTEARGGDWRSVIDGVRPFTQQIWQKMPLAAKRRFLEHARAWWDVHRHRMAPEIAARVSQVVAEGRLTIIAGKVQSLERKGSCVDVIYRRRGAQRTDSVRVANIIECKGIASNPIDTTNLVLRSLIDQGLARADPMQIGIDVTEACAIVGHSGKPSKRLFAVGPLTRAAFWEVVAIPDIRVQCAQLAKQIKAELTFQGACGVGSSPRTANFLVEVESC